MCCSSEKKWSENRDKWDPFGHAILGDYMKCKGTHNMLQAIHTK